MMERPQKTDGPQTGTGRGGVSEFLHSWRYFVWMLALILLGLLFVGEENWRGRWAWNRYKQALAARGESMEMQAWVPPTVPDDKNFAETPFLAPLFDFIPGTQTWPGNALANHFASNYDAASRELKSRKTPGLNSWVKPRTDLGEWYAAFLASKGKTNKAPYWSVRAKPTKQGDAAPQTTAQRDPGMGATNYAVAQAARGVLDMLAETDPVFTELDAARQLPYCRFNLHYTKEDPAGILLPHLSVLRHLCQVLQLRASAELALEQRDTAFRDVGLMLYLTDACHDEPFVVSQLVRIACLDLAFQPVAEGMEQWSDADLRAFQDRLERFDFCTDTSRTMKAERVWTTSIIDYFQRSQDKLHLMDEFFNGQQPAGIGLGAVLMMIAPTGWYDLEKLNCARTIDEVVLPTVDPVQRRIDPRLCEAAGARIAALNNQSMPGLFFGHRFLGHLLLSGQQRLAQKAAFAQTGVNCVIAACGLELYRREHGRFPEKLEELVPGSLKKLPPDVITGEMLKYHIEGGPRYRLYSVGWNGSDEGGVPGEWKNAQDPGLAEGDWVWTWR